MSHNRFVLVQTDLFQLEQPDEEIDQWRPGGDCAGWFYARLLPRPEVARHCEPVMEDWGWTMAVTVNSIPVWISIWEYLEIDTTWLLGVEARKRFFSRASADVLARVESLVVDSLETIIRAEPRITAHKWYAENPFDALITSL